MVQTYKNAPLKLAKYQNTGSAGESFILSDDTFYCESIEASLQASVEADYRDGHQFAEDYVPRDYIQSELSIQYLLTGADPLRTYFTDDKSRISGNFGGMYFKEGKLASYQIEGQPNAPIKVNATIKFFDQLSGEFTATDQTEPDDIVIPNFYNLGFNNRDKKALGGDVNLLNFSYSFENELTPIRLTDSTVPDKIRVGKKQVSFNAELDVVSGQIPVSGEFTDLVITLKDFDHNEIDTLPITGKLVQRSLSTSTNNIVRSRVAIFSTQVDEQPTITNIVSNDFSDASGNSRSLVSISGANLCDAHSVVIGDTSYNRTQDNLTVPQLHTMAETVADNLRGIFSVKTNDDGTCSLDVVTSLFALSNPPTVITPAGQVKSTTNANVVDDGITISGITPNPADIGSSLTISGSGFYRVNEIYFGDDISTANFTLQGDQGKIISVNIPQLAPSGDIKVKSNDRDKSGIYSYFVPNPQITGADIYTGVTGVEVQIYGFGLNHVTGVSISSGEVTTASNQTTTSITATVASDAAFGKIVGYGDLGSTGVSQFDFQPIPLLTGTDPLTGSIGGQIDVWGISLTDTLLYSPEDDGNYLVKFQGGASGLFHRVGDDRITGYIPTGASNGLIQPFKNATEVYYSEASLDLGIQAPEITGVSVFSGHDDSVKVYGHNMDSATGMCFVSIRTNTEYPITGDYFKVFDSVAQPFVWFNNVSYFSPDEGLQNIVLKYQDGAVTGSGVGNGFYYQTEPSITSVTRTSGVISDELIVEGTGFYPNNTKVYFRNAAAESSKFHGESPTYLADNLGIKFDISAGLSSLLENIISDFETGSVLAKNHLGTTTGDQFDLINGPYISGFEQTSGLVGDTITVTGAGFVSVTDVSVNGTSASFTPVSSAELTFDIPANANDGLVEVTTTGGYGTSFDFGPLDIRVGNISVSGFDPQPAFPGDDLATITGVNLITASALHITGESTLTLNFSLGEASQTGFITGENNTSGTYLQFVTPASAKDNNPIRITNADGDFTSAINFRVAKTTDYLINSGYSGVEIEGGSITGYYGKEVVIIGSGFNSTEAVVTFASGNENTEDAVSYFSGEVQSRIADNLIKVTIPSGINDNFLPVISGKVRGNNVFSPVSVETIVLPTINGVSETVLNQGDIVEISGINTSRYPWHISGELEPALAPNDVTRLKDFVGLDPNLGYFPTDLKIGITGVSYDGQKTVEYLSDFIKAGNIFNGQNFIDLGNGDLKFEANISDRFFGTGRLFLVHPADINANGSGELQANGTVITRSIEDFAGATGFGSSMTAAELNNIIFDQAITINENEPVISGFDPNIGAEGTSITLSGNHMAGITGISIFSGSVESVAVANTTFTSQSSSQIVFNAPAFDDISGRLRLRSKNFEVDSTDNEDGHFRYAQSAAGASIAPSQGPHGATITVSASAGLNDTTEVRLVTIDDITVTGAFTINGDDELTFTVPSEGRLPGEQTVSVQAYNGTSTTVIGNFTVLEGFKNVYGDMVVTGDMTVSGSGNFALPVTIGTGDLSYVFPNERGSNDQILKTDANGNVTWQAEAGGGSPGGNDREIQFNDDGSFGGSGVLFFKDIDSFPTFVVSGEIGTETNGNIRLGSAHNDEGGQITLLGGTGVNYTDLNWTIDSYQEVLRIFEGVDNLVRINRTGIGVNVFTPLAAVHVVGGITGDAVTGNQMEITQHNLGIVIPSPDGTRWRITVDNDGALTSEEV